MSLNHIVIQGRLTKDPEIKTTNNGTTLANFTVACDRDYQSGSEKQTDFVDCIAFKNTASFIERNFHKGQMILVSGRLQSRKWEDRNGNSRTSWEVVTNDVNFCGDKKSDTGNTKPVSVFTDMDDDSDGELPF